MSGYGTILDLVIPVRGKWVVTSPYGWRGTGKSRNFHNGLDLAKLGGGTEGSPIYAMQPTVVRNAIDQYGGLYQDLKIGSRTVWRFVHNSTFEVANNSKVSQGDLIGKAGNTGLSTGAHVHLELHVDGKQVDPYNTLLQINQQYVDNINQELRDIKNQIRLITHKPRFQSLTYKGARYFLTKGDGSNRIYLASFNYKTKKFKQWELIDGQIDRDSIDLDIQDDLLYIFVRGLSSPLYYRTFDGKKLGEWITNK